MTRKFYTKEQFKAYAKQQIIENNDLIDAWTITKESVRNFDNKVINKRLKDHIDNSFKKEFDYAFFTFTKQGSGYYFEIYVRDNDSYPTGEFSVSYVKYQSYVYTDDIGDDKRINAEAIINRIESTIRFLLDENKILKNEIEDLDNIEAEYNAIKSMIENFKYDKSRYISKLYSL